MTGIPSAEALGLSELVTPSTQSITSLLLGLDDAKAEDSTILKLFGAESFIATTNANYDQIETVARTQGLLA